MVILIAVVILTILVTFTCALYEAILYSTRRTALEAERAKETRKNLANRFIELKKNIAEPIAAIVILNTIANTGGATVAGMYANETLGIAYMPLFSVGITLAILTFGEIVPKTLGAVYWRSLWPIVLWPVLAIGYALYPAVLVAQKFTNLLTKGKEVPVVTEEEILALVRIGAKEGEITDRESRLVHNIIGLENRQVREIMTPRTVIFSLDANMPVGDAVREVDEKGFTRIPVYETDRENIVGYIITHALFSAKTLADRGAAIRTIAKPISFVPQTKDCLALLTTSLQKREYIFIVVDEYGGVAGLVTLEDLIETLLGAEIVDETDRAVDLQDIARKKRGQVPTAQ